MAVREEVAVIGLGAMGRGMAHRLLSSGFHTVVFNRTRTRTDELVAAGAERAPTAARAAAGRNVVLLSLSDEEAVEDVLVEQGVLAAMDKGATLLDTSAVGRDFARRIHERCSAHGVRRVESAVIGNPLQARTGDLRVFTAGDPADADRVDSVLSVLGASRVHLGEPGTAAAAKLVFNLVLAAQVAGLAEAVCVGESAGLDRELLLTAIAQSGFSSPVMRFRAELMRERRYVPAFFRTRLMEKDLRLALETGEADAGTYRVLEATRSLFGDAALAGLADSDAAAVIEHVARTTAEPLPADGVSRPDRAAPVGPRP
ncbi:NAD(P)-dependent oxidoreductase [Streptomyces ipomoeae]|jgi:3-hydroxyisobutyrate dehydrogenase|uniref:NAD(P)-dependent oxidoreductase n=1 Tax=Streptomyces ipomoeae TaxID=103232 RepID=A0AAE8W492_9ACTN|nr:NAD(P)-dependent oxidoreductase [Streptomyces ipomoeae]MDX2820633.1 NAD(P)-dependent oxidoreductase [Streptomyces ipomoeae]MDX2873141.1 NAD(P)-dependent oxidoreductase [Streptomyces ipomoeae]TQE32383.1 NAD(P)-dependent oxidoreductase [Streptomyces ipomoeae]TQE36360.1 NAD(P)-dependent oxidoreductase [Streptomyces ipomoeae]